MGAHAHPALGAELSLATPDATKQLTLIGPLKFRAADAKSSYAEKNNNQGAWVDARAAGLGEFGMINLYTALPEQWEVIEYWIVADDDIVEQRVVAYDRLHWTADLTPGALELGPVEAHEKSASVAQRLVDSTLAGFRARLGELTPGTKMPSFPIPAVGAGDYVIRRLRPAERAERIAEAQASFDAAAEAAERASIERKRADLLAAIEKRSSQAAAAKQRLAELNAEMLVSA